MVHDSDMATTEACRSYPFSRSRLDPDPQYAELRGTQPVCRVQLPYGPPAWLVTSYELTRSVLGDARFSRAATVGRDNPRECPVEFGQVTESVLCMDPPAHTRIRQLAGRAFTARRVEQLRPRARQIASGLIDGMAAAGPPADLVESFSFAFPAIIICELLGIPEADRHAFRRWTDAIVSTTTASSRQEQEIYLHLAGYLASLFAQRRARPGDDLLTWLVQARDNQDRLTEAELLFLGMALLVGGYETTAQQITNMVYTLLTHGLQLRQLKARPELLPGAVEEMLRFIVFGNAVNPRIATADVRLGRVVGTCRPAGAVRPHLGQPRRAGLRPRRRTRLRPRPEPAPGFRLRAALLPGRPARADGTPGGAGHHTGPAPRPADRRARGPADLAHRDHDARPGRVPDHLVNPCDCSPPSGQHRRASGRDPDTRRGSQTAPRQPQSRV